MKIITIGLLIAVNLISCQKKINNLDEISNVTSNDTIELLRMHIKLQEMYELPENNTDISHLYQLTDIDYELGGYAVAKMLGNSGYKEISDDDFKDKIKLFFESSPDSSMTNKKEHKTFYTLFVNNSKEKDIEKTEDDYTYNHIFIFPKYKIISKIPLLEGFVKINNNKLSFIQDENIIHRNKYLFNNSKADFVWLLFNDKEFLKNLLIVFGYDKEEKINEFVLEEFYKEYSSSIPMITDKIGEIFFIKDYSGKLQIREGLLKYVSQNTTKDDDRFIYALGNYLDNLFDENEDIQKKFTLEEKAKIVAYVANIESPAFYKYKGIERPLNLEPQSAWVNAGTSLYNITAAHPEILEIIIKNNYYGLQPLKEAINSDEFINEKTTRIPSDKDFSNKSKVGNKFYLYDRPDFSSFSKEIIAKEDVEIVHENLGWKFVKINGVSGYLPTEEKQQELQKEDKKKFSFLANEEDIKPEKKKGFWRGLFG